MFIRRLVSFFVAFGTFFSLVFDGDGDVYFKNRVKINMVYGAGERQVLDLYLPRKAEGDIGLILFLHGGAWIGGDKESYRDHHGDDTDAPVIMQLAVQSPPHLSHELLPPFNLSQPCWL